MTSVALVVLDTLRKDYFDEYFDWLPGRWFDHCYSPSHRTPPVHASLFCGRYPSELGVYTDTDQLDCPDPTLAEVLSESTYQTRAFSANTYVTSHFGFDRGFKEFETPWQLAALDGDVFDFQSHVGESDKDGIRMYLSALGATLRSDKPTLRSLIYGAKLFGSSRGMFGLGDDGAHEALSYVEQLEVAEKEFFFCNLMEAHEPYEPPADYRTVELHNFPTTVEVAMREYDVDPVKVEQAYEDSVQYLASKYRDIFAELRSSFDYVITCADHGELFDRDGLWGHFFGLYPELSHVPLVVSGPELDDEHRPEVVSLLDVHRTVLDLTDVEAESRGRSLVGAVTSGSFLTECHGIAQRRLDNLQHEPDALERARQYDVELSGIATPVDYYGYETIHDFIETGESVHENPRSTMVDLSDSLTRVSGERGDVSNSVQNRLEDLGYM